MESPQRPPPLAPPCTILPPKAREILIAAWRVRDPRERIFAVDEAIDRVHAMYPQHFRSKPTIED